MSQPMRGKRVTPAEIRRVVFYIVMTRGEGDITCLEDRDYAEIDTAIQRLLESTQSSKEEK